MKPALAVTIPRSALPLDERHDTQHSCHAVAWQAQTVLMDDLRLSAVARVTEGTDLRIGLGLGQAWVLNLRTISTVDLIVCALLANPGAWRRSHEWGSA
jgi:hypothetical protein